MKNRLLLFLIIPTLMLSACVFPSNISEVGKDTFSVSSTSGVALASKSRGEVFEMAKKHCVSLGKEFMLVSETRVGDPIVTITITYRALDKNDPEYKRPNVQQVPDVVIEDRRAN